MSVYSDFMNYQSGVYIKQSNASYLGGHCIKILGWGSENNVDYWVKIIYSFFLKILLNFLFKINRLLVK